jgi:hypothetical protein
MVESASFAPSYPTAPSQVKISRKVLGNEVNYLLLATRISSRKSIIKVSKPRGLEYRKRQAAPPMDP